MSENSSPEALERAPETSRAEPEASPNKSTETHSGLSAGSAAVLIVLILAATTIAIWFRFFQAAEENIDRGMDSIDQAVVAAAKAAVSIAQEFHPEHVNETFISWAQPEAKGNEGNILEIATATATESFASRTYYTAFGKEVPGSEVVSKITVPATYRYHIDLNSHWDLVSRDQRMYVVAPLIEPSLPVAIDTSKMKKEIEGSWLRMGENEDLEALQKTLTTELAIRSADEKTIEQIRDEARLSVAKFVKAWLLNQDHWRGDGFTEIIVLFDNEVDDVQNYDFESRLPTLRWVDEQPENPLPDETSEPAIQPAVLP